MSQNITAATAEQTSNARQVSTAVENVNELTQSAASAAEEMSRATEMLAGMAQELQKLTEQFKIEEIAAVEDEAPSLPGKVAEKRALPPAGLRPPR